MNKWCWDNWTSTGKNMNLDTKFTPFKNELKWTTDLNVKCKTVKFLEGNIGENTGDLGFSDDFLDIKKA